MILRPVIFTDEELQSISVSSEKLPLKTYKLDMNTGEIYAEFIDLNEAIKQAVIKAISTRRDQYVIYSSNYGCEIFSLLGHAFGQDYLNLEVPRVINEALVIYDWFVGTDSYVITSDSDTLTVSFQVNTNIGQNVQVEVSI